MIAKVRISLVRKSFRNGLPLILGAIVFILSSATGSTQAKGRQWGDLDIPALGGQGDVQLKSQQLRLADRTLPLPPQITTVGAYGQPRVPDSLRWVLETVDMADDAGTFVSAAVVPGSSHIYVSYYDASHGDLRLAYDIGSGGNCGPGNTWSCNPIDTAGDRGQYNSIAVWSGGGSTKIGISYYDASLVSLRYGEYSTLTKSWSFTTVEYGSIGELTHNGLYTSLRFTSTGMPVIAFQQQHVYGPDTLRLATFVGGGYGDCSDLNWRCTDIDNGEGVGQYASLALTANNQPRIAYHHPVIGTIRYAHQIDGGGSCSLNQLWQCDDIQSINDNEAYDGYGPHIALQEGQSSTIAYYDANEVSLYLATSTAAGSGNCGPGNTWRCDPIQELFTPADSIGISMALDPAGTPILAYREGLNTFKVAQPTSRLGLAAGNCGPFSPDSPHSPTWQCDMVDDGRRGGEWHLIGGYPSVIVDGSGLISTVYYDSTAGDLLTARQKDFPAGQCGGVYLPVADTTLRSDAPGQSFGSNPELQVMSTGVISRTALLAFNIAGTIPPDATIHKAELELHLIQETTPTPFRFQLQTVNGAWSEADVTWNNPPTQGAALPPKGSSSQSYSQGYPLRVDVRDLVNLWGSDGVNETTIVLKAVGDLDLRAHSREAIDPGLAPRLVIDCAPPLEMPVMDEADKDKSQIAGFERLRLNSKVTPYFRLLNGAVSIGKFDVEPPASMPGDTLARARWFTTTYSDMLRLDDPETELQLVRRAPDNQSLFFRQLHQGIPVVPAGISLHFTAGRITLITGGYLPSIPMPPTPLLEAHSAENLALAYAPPGAEITGETQLTYLNLGLTGHPDHHTYLTWQVPMSEAIYYIDANNGALRFDSLRTNFEYELDLHTSDYKIGDNSLCHFLILQKMSSDTHLCSEKGCNPAGTADPDAVNAWFHIRDVWHWWHGALGRNSFNGDGEEVNLNVHTTFLGDNGNVMLNAASMGACNLLAFSDGYANAADVVGHEFTHSVVRYTSELVYSGQSGAINESMADIFGEFAEMYHRNAPIDWLHGEDNPGGPSRDIKSPPQHDQPERMVDIYGGELDHGGVHKNNGIPNKAAYLMITGDYFSGYKMPGALDWPKASWLLYYVMQDLPSNATFETLREIAIWDATHEHGFTATDVCTVKTAYAAVGIGAPDENCDGLDDWVGSDKDGDHVPDSIDNCPEVQNTIQNNTDNDNQGNACDDDDDGDGVPDKYFNFPPCPGFNNGMCGDNCPLVQNADQADTVHMLNGIGDACEDPDKDMLMDKDDKCPNNPGPNTDHDFDGIFDPCDDNDDEGPYDSSDKVPDNYDKLGNPGDDPCPGYNDGHCDDNCQFNPNNDQLDNDGDHMGNACDLCPDVSYQDNTDTDGDGIPNACDTDDDEDGILDNADGHGNPGDNPCSCFKKLACPEGQICYTCNTQSCDDNCILDKNTAQTDYDSDGIGHACDPDEPLSPLEQFVYQEFHTMTTPAIDFTLDAPPPPLNEYDFEYLPPNFEYEINVGLDVPFFAQVLDNSGNLLTQTSSSQVQQEQQFFRFIPVPAFTNPGGGNLLNSTITGLPPDQMGYRLRIQPMGGFQDDHVYQLSLGYHGAVRTYKIHLPLIVRTILGLP